MDTDRNLLFGVIAMQGELIDAAQFAEACAGWAVSKHRPLADLLVERGWIDAADRAAIERLLEHKVRRHQGDAHRSLIAHTADDVIRRTLDALKTLGDADLAWSLADLPRPGDATVEYRSILSAPSPTRDRYTLTTMHARGGIGQVWLARDTTLDREVALKELRPECLGNAAVIRRFVQEARITGQLNHPSVVPVHELTQHGEPGREQPYYTMRFVEGRTLSSACAEYHARRARGETTAVDLLTLVQAFLGVCNTVAFAHSRNVIHRDLKGSNIMLGQYGEVILLDWGLAKRVDQPGVDDDPLATIGWNTPSDNSQELTQAGQVLGTPAFMAPEQAIGQLDRIDHRTDVYGLGAILYEILAGRPPFLGTSTEEILHQVCDQIPAPPRTFVPGIPRALEAICLKALEKDPGARYASAVALADDVRHWLADEPVSVFPDPWSTRARRWIGRNRTLASTAAVAMGVSLVALGGLTLIQARANRDLAQALRAAEEARTDAERQNTFGNEAVEAFYSGVSEDLMLRRPELTGLRARLLRVPLTYYTRQVQWQRERKHRLGSIPLEYVRGLALDLDRIASIQAQIGNRDEAIASRQQLVAIYDDNPALGPEHAAKAMLDLGNLQRLAGKPADATRSLRDALARFDRLVNPDNPFTSSRLALAQADLGRQLADTGQIDEGRRLLEKARDLQAKLTGQDPRTTRYREELAATWMTLGNLADSEGKLEEALHDHEQAATLMRQSFDSAPANVWYKAELARALNNLGLIRARNGHPDEGLRELDRAQTLREELLAAQPLNIEYRADLARSAYHRVLFEMHAGAPEKARAAIDRAEALYRDIPPKGPEDLYFQACLLSLRAELAGAGKPASSLTPAERAEQQRLADQAVDRLRQAVQAGYSSPTLIRNTRALQFLRGRPDYQKWVESLSPTG